ncbi:hypothetical protein [Hubei permutotetra-like virus 4]|uniref:hypothetical protein n=1 Tax=Hubei permutotetra-like virus 4 TaxID=1923078 RepID=UPI00090A3A81|nr:hypothetical protein [Hubei permutotetra-like virus 4]APG76940.1 hypothetical protein [Hubei permutotetra-like virus 4]
MRQFSSRGRGATNNVNARNTSGLSHTVYKKDFTLTTDSFTETVSLEDGGSYRLIPSVQTETEDEDPLDPDFEGLITNIVKPPEQYSNTAHLKFYPLRDILKFRAVDFQLNLHLSLEIVVDYPTDIEALSILWDFSQCIYNAQVKTRRERVEGDRVLFHCVAAGLYKYVPVTRPFFKLSVEWTNTGITSSLAYTMKTQLYAFGLFGDARQQEGFVAPCAMRILKKRPAVAGLTQFSRSRAMILGY